MLLEAVVASEVVLEDNSSSADTLLLQRGESIAVLEFQIRQDQPCVMTMKR